MTCRIALLADIHGNLPALDAVLDDASRHAVDLTLHLGDLVGYGPWPKEVMARIQERGIAGVAGNYDSTVGFRREHCGCRAATPEAEADSRASFSWTRAQMSEPELSALRSLPFRLDIRPDGGDRSVGTAILVHGTPTLNTLYWDQGRSDEFCRRMIAAAHATAGHVIACGHTHIPWIRTVDGVLLVNAGSVGRPKDGNPAACYAILEWDQGDWKASHHRVAYDTGPVVAAIHAAGLPSSLARTIETGVA